MSLLSISRAYLGPPPPPHQGPPMHHVPGHEGRGPPPHDMRGGPLAEPRPLMAEPRGPMIDQRGPPMDARGKGKLSQLQLIAVVGEEFDSLQL